MLSKDRSLGWSKHQIAQYGNGFCHIFFSLRKYLLLAWWFLFVLVQLGEQSGCTTRKNVRNATHISGIIGIYIFVCDEKRGNRERERKNRLFIQLKLFYQKAPPETIFHSVHHFILLLLLVLLRVMLLVAGPTNKRVFIYFGRVVERAAHTASKRYKLNIRTVNRIYIHHFSINKYKCLFLFPHLAF